MTASSAYHPRPFEATFGYFNTSDSSKPYVNKMHRTINFMNALGVIPVIGTIVGIARIIFFAGKKHANDGAYSASERAFFNYQITRGAVETLSVGVIFLIPDLIRTFVRQLESSVKENTWFYHNFGTFAADM